MSTRIGNTLAPPPPGATVVEEVVVVNDSNSTNTLIKPTTINNDLTNKIGNDGPTLQVIKAEDIDQKGVVGTVYENLDEKSKSLVTGMTVFAILWGLLGFAGFITSFVCLGYEGDTGVKIGGILLALFLGPFYWIYFGVLRYKKKYCMPKIPELPKL